MIDRLMKLSTDYSAFLFGPRGTGKSTLLREIFARQQTLYLDLLDPAIEARFANKLQTLLDIAHALPDTVQHIVIDEIQKLPKLLDVAHTLIEKKHKRVIMSGSSPRKLKRGAANLLAGRAFVYNLYPFVYLELADKFNLSQALQYGSLPKLYEIDDDVDKQRYLQSYAQTYLKEEVVAEQLVRNLDPFRYFLEVSAQCNGKIINLSRIAQDVGVVERTVKQYFQILEDTLVGFFLYPFKHSFRKRLSQKPKFYYFDTGVVKALTRTLSLPLSPGTSAYAEAFEHFVILEAMRLVNYFKPEYRLSYLQTKDGAEVDLIVERPGLPHLFIEIKSSEDVKETQLGTLKSLAKDFGACEALCFSRDIYPKQYNGVLVLPWQEGLQRFFVPAQS